MSEPGPLKFNDLIGLSVPPERPEPARRMPIDSQAGVAHGIAITDDPLNNGLLTGFVNAKRAAGIRPSRRGFLRGLGAGLSAVAATAMTSFGRAQEVRAQTGIVGTYPRRILQFCPPHNSGDDCQPGCGSSPICSDCCSGDGYFRNEPASGYFLYPGGCGDGDIADGWIWRYNSVCGNCSTIEYRCSDGYVQTDTGPAPFICRWVTECLPLEDGQQPGPNLADASRSTSWRPASSLELAVDNGGSVTLRGWIADTTGNPVPMRITSSNQILHVGEASLPRPDVASRIRGAGPKTGFEVTFPAEPGNYTYCVHALSGALAVTVGCIDLNVGSGQAVRGPALQASSGASASNQPSGPTVAADQLEAEDDETGPVNPGAVEIIRPVEAIDMAESRSRQNVNRALYGMVAALRRTANMSGFASGWAGDIETGDNVYVEVLVNDSSAGIASTWLPRKDVALAYPGLGPNTGYALTFDLPEAECLVCLEAVSTDGAARKRIGCRTLGAPLEVPSEALDVDPGEQTQIDTPGGTEDQTQAPDRVTPVIYGLIDEADISSGAIYVSGWAFDPNDHQRQVSVRVEAFGEGATPISRTEVEARSPHPLAGHRYGVSGDHGFEIQIERPSGLHGIRIEALAADGKAILLGEQSVKE